MTTGRENSDSNSVTNNHVVTRGSNLSLNLSAGHTNEVHRSSTSLNDNMMSRGSDCRFEGANNEINSGLSAGNTALTYQSNIGPNPGDTGRTSTRLSIPDSNPYLPDCTGVLCVESVLRSTSDLI
jgi:hypothetical protein